MSAETTSPIPVVLLHGVGLDKTVWADVERRLARTTVALDLPGHGAQPPLTAQTSLSEFADDVVARMPEGPAHLVGFSLGALTAMEIAIRHPSRVISLTCVNAVCARTEEESEAVLARLRIASTDFRESMTRALDRWFPEDTPNNRRLRDETNNVLMANNVDSYLHAYEVFATGDKVLEPRLSGISVPTLAITGELDPGSTPEMSRRIAERIPNTTVHIIAGAHHMVPVTHSAILADKIQELINVTERNQQ